MTMSESDTRSGRRLLNRAAEKRKRGDGGDGSLLISPELRGKGEEKLGVRWRTPPDDLTSVSIGHFRKTLSDGREGGTI